MHGCHSDIMGERIQIPDIPERERTPKVLGLVDVIEQLVQKVRQQEEKIAQLYRRPAYDVCCIGVLPMMCVEG